MIEELIDSSMANTMLLLLQFAAALVFMKKAGSQLLLHQCRQNRR